MPETTNHDAVSSTRQQKQKNDLENILETTKPRGWWALGFISVAIVLVGIWASLANVPQTATGTGVVNTLVYAFDVTAPATGNVVLTGITGGNVSAGATIGTITTDTGTQVPVVSNWTGQIASLAIGQNSYVRFGDTLLTVSTVADPSSPIHVITFLGESEMLNYPLGAIVDVSATDVVSGRSVYTTAKVVSEGSTPSSEATLNATNGNLSVLTNEWLTNSSGSPFAVFLEIDNWPTGDSSFSPSGGLVVKLSHTYDTIHPISWLFGGK
jgi:hypothetical protein